MCPKIHHSHPLPRLYLHLFEFCPLCPQSDPADLGTSLTCRGPLAGMVDLSDVRSMSRPGSPRSVFPSPCIIEPSTGSRAPGRRKKWEFGMENANVRSAGCRNEREWPWTPGTKLQGWHAEDTNKWLIHPILVPTHPLTLFLCPSICLPVFSLSRNDTHNLHSFSLCLAL